MKKLISILLSLALCLGILPPVALAAGDSITLDGTEYADGGDAEKYLDLGDVTEPAYFTAGEGKIYYDPDSGLLTLDNAECEVYIFGEESTRFEVKGVNQIGAVSCAGDLTLTGSGSLTTEMIYVENIAFTDTGFSGTLNALVMVMDRSEEGPASKHCTAHGTVTLRWEEMYVDPEAELTVLPGATLTIPEDCTLYISDLDCFINQGTIVNNGVIELLETAAKGDPSETIPKMGLTGDGKVQVGEDSYTNAGRKICEHIFGEWDENRERECTVCHEKEHAAAKVVMEGGEPAYYANAVTWAAEQKVVSGIGNNLFAPNRDISREELATMLWRYAGSPKPDKATLDFTDSSKVSTFAKEAMLWAND